MNPLWAPKMNTCKKKLDWDLFFWDIYSFWKILDPDRSWIWIQDFCPGYNLRLDIVTSELVSGLRFSSQRNWGKTKKQSMNFRPKQSLKSFGFCCLWFYSRFCCKAYPHPLRVAAVGSARYCIILNLAGHYPGVHFLIVCAPSQKVT